MFADEILFLVNASIAAFGLKYGNTTHSLPYHTTPVRHYTILMGSMQDIPVVAAHEILSTGINTCLELWKVG